ncbi:MAG: nuclear transport factor 2 family protein [Flavobacteriaceae bacterium]|nr:nuclear transport factor 2 family protein [Flavobacteriaceae bacterium]
MNTNEVANKLVNYCRNMEFDAAVNELYANHIVSLEPPGSPNREVRGIEAVRQKGEEFNNMLEAMHGLEVSDPLIADNFFSCTMKMDVTFKGGPRTTMEEVCMYQVDNGKIVKEEFFFTPQKPPQ